MSKRILNLGSGEMLRKECVNFDYVEFKRGDLKTDVIGRIEDICKIFSPEEFDEVICFHVLEHFYYTDTCKVIADVYTLIKPGGKFIAETPDIVGMYTFWIGERNNPMGLIEGIYGDEKHRLKWGPEWMHKSGWTKELMAEAFTDAGFTVTKTGPGISHGMGTRDLRVEGIK